MPIDTDRFEKFKESEHYILYVQKKPVIPGRIDIIVQHKKTGHSMQCALTDAIFKLFFEPEEYKKIYMRQK